jgi:hypothetical protein
MWPILRLRMLAMCSLLLASIVELVVSSCPCAAPRRWLADTRAAVLAWSLQVCRSRGSDAVAPVNALQTAAITSSPSWPSLLSHATALTSATAHSWLAAAPSRFSSTREFARTAAVLNDTHPQPRLHGKDKAENTRMSRSREESGCPTSRQIWLELAALGTIFTLWSISLGR